MDGWLENEWVIDFLLYLTHFWYVKSDNSVAQKEKKRIVSSVG